MGLTMLKTSSGPPNSRPLDSSLTIFANLPDFRFCQNDFSVGSIKLVCLIFWFLLSVVNKKIGLPATQRSGDRKPFVLGFVCHALMGITTYVKPSSSFPVMRAGDC